MQTINSEILILPSLLKNILLLKSNLRPPMRCCCSSGDAVGGGGGGSAVWGGGMDGRGLVLQIDATSTGSPPRPPSCPLKPLMPPPTASSAPATNPPKVLSDPTDQNPAVDEVAGAVKGAVPPVTVDGQPKAEVELGTAAWCLQSNRDVLSHDLV